MHEGHSTQRREKITTRFFAAAAHVSANTAVLMMRCMQVAFVSASPASNRACLQNRAGHVCIVCGTTRQYAAGRRADVGTVEICANAFGEVCDTLFAKVGVRARRAGLSALYAGFDTSDQHGPVDTTEPTGVGLQHATYGAHRTALQSSIN